MNDAKRSKGIRDPSSATFQVAASLDFLREATDDQKAIFRDEDEIRLLDESLPLELRVFETGSDGVVVPRSGGLGTPTVSTSRRVRRVVEATTSWLRSDTPFAASLARVDAPATWADGAAQMRVVGEFVPDTRPGDFLWRGRLRKVTDFTAPVSTGLVVDDTVELTATGTPLSKPGQPEVTSGWRRIEHRLVATADSKEADLFEDTGWIEVRGTPAGCTVRLHKRIGLLYAEDSTLALLSPLLESMLELELELWARSVFPEPSSAVFRSAATERPASLKASQPARSVATTDVGTDKVARVAVVGGGPAGLAAAWLLSQRVDAAGLAANQLGWIPLKDPNLKVAVTLYESSWRPGGKCASGRREGGVVSDRQDRIEEHGLHILFGFYRNVQNLLAAVGGNPEMSLEPFFDTLLPGLGGRDLTSAWRVTLGDKPVPLARRSELVKVPFGEFILKLEKPGPDGGIRELNLGSISLPEEVTADTPALLRLLTRLGKVPGLSKDALKTTAPRSLARALIEVQTESVLLRNRSGGDPGADDRSANQNRTLRRVGGGARLLRHLARAAFPEGATDPDVQRSRELFELMTTVLSGLDRIDALPSWLITEKNEPEPEAYRDWVLQLNGNIDGISATDWLIASGCTKGTAEDGAILRALCGSVFTTPKQLSAAAMVNGAFRLLLGFDDAPYYRMKGGMGEVFVRPIHDVLEAASDRVTIAARTRVESLTTVPGTAQATGLSFASAKAPPPDFVAPKAIGASSASWGVTGPTSPPDFGVSGSADCDAVIIAAPPWPAPIGGLPPDVDTRLRGIGSTATVGLQVWTNGPALYPKAIVAGYSRPLDSAASMDHLVPGVGVAAADGQESFGAAQSVVYHCGAVSETELADWQSQPAATASAWVAANTSRFQLGTVVDFPGAPPGAFVSVNGQGSARYVLSDPQTQKNRPGIRETGLDNVWFAGDWTRNGLSVGSVEAAVMSGLEAARDLLETLGCDVHCPIPGSLVFTTPKTNP